MDRNHTDYGFEIDPDQVSEAFLEDIASLNRLIDQKKRAETEKKQRKSSV